MMMVDEEDAEGGEVAADFQEEVIKAADFGQFKTLCLRVKKYLGKVEFYVIIPLNHVKDNSGLILASRFLNVGWCS